MLEPGELHRTLSVPPEAAFKVALIPVSAVEAAATEFGAHGAIHLARAETADPDLTNAVWRLGEAIERADVEALELQTMQAMVLRRLFDHAERSPRINPRIDEAIAVNRARDYLLDRLHEPVSLDELTAAAGLGRFQLLRAFSRHFGVPPHAFQLHLRIERGRELLRRGAPAGLVAIEVGFCDQSHFTRHFKKITGVTPGEYAGR